MVVNLPGKLAANLGSIVNNTTNAGGNLQIYSSYTGTDTGVALSGGGNLYMTVYAPRTNVVVTNDSKFLGSLLGQTVVLSGNSTALHDDTQLLMVWAGIFGL